MVFDKIRNFSNEARRWGFTSALKIYFDRFINYSDLGNRRFAKASQSFLAKTVFWLQLRRGTPVFVYQMGKVGSTSVYLSLLRRLPGAVVHSHNFMADHPRYQTRRLYQWAIVEKRPINVISLVREPLSRNVSALFQNYQRDLGTPFNGEQVSYEKLMGVLLSKYHPGMTRWFEKHIQKNFGIDVYAEPFPESGFATYALENVRLLVVRLEISNGEKEKAIREFLGLDRFQIVNANVGSEKNYAEQYAKFKSLVRLPKDYVGAICDSKFARHFYSPEVIEKARATWTQPSN